MASSTDVFRPVQMRLDFELPARWNQPALEAALSRAAGRPVRLRLTDNRSVLLSFQRREGRVDLRLHGMFVHAPDDVVAALGRSLVARRRQREAAAVRRFMNENMHRVRRVERSLPPIVASGQVHDLAEIFAGLNASFFGNALSLPITWGRGAGRAHHRGITFGSYDPVLRLIRIHPVLDRADVPRHFLESVVYHEMLHHHLGGVPDAAGRTVYHSRAFREAERRYPQHAEALRWEKANFARLLRASRALTRRRERPRQAPAPLA
jgi:hypothetical protein